MERIRKPYQGVRNIVRFNWHFYVLAIALIMAVIFLNILLSAPWLVYINLMCMIVIVTTNVSLLVSYYIYDVSDLYQLRWLDKMTIPNRGTIINIHAGFDETSILIKAKFPDADLTVLDFYDPRKHTEVSIRRAREAYPPFPHTHHALTSHLHFPDHTADTIFATLSAHEIRNDTERAAFFKELKRIVKPAGVIIVTEHLRDLPNFAAYNIGFFHFLSRGTWMRTFREASLNISEEIKTTPFITTFILRKNGTAS